jgi:hypothetical protein
MSRLRALTTITVHQTLRSSALVFSNPELYWARIGAIPHGSAKYAENICGIDGRIEDALTKLEVARSPAKAGQCHLWQNACFIMSRSLRHAALALCPRPLDRNPTDNDSGCLKWRKLRHAATLQAPSFGLTLLPTMNCQVGQSRNPQCWRTCLACP